MSKRKRWIKKLRKIRGSLISLLVLIIIVIIIVLVGLAILTGSQISSQRGQTFSEYEEKFLNQAVALVENCLGPSTDKNPLCSSYVFPQNPNRYEFIYLQDLIDKEVLEAFADPYHEGKKCSGESYVYVSSRSDTTNSPQYDLNYHVCLMCGDKKSKDCLATTESDEKYELSCQVAYDPEGTVPYDGKWTDQNLYLILNASGDFASKVSKYCYHIGEDYVFSDVEILSNQKALVTLDRNIANQFIQVDSYDDSDQKATAGCGNYPIRIDKNEIQDVIITGILSNPDRDLVESGDYSSMEVILEANVNPTDSPSGYQYVWYRNGEIYRKTTLLTLMVDEDGSYQVEVSNALGKKKMSEEFVVHIDKKKPEIKVLDKILTLSFKEDYDFKKNIKVTFGSSGGSFTCDPENNNYLGDEDTLVTCKAVGNNGLETKASFTVKHKS